MTGQESLSLTASLERGPPATVLALHCSEARPRAAFDETIARLIPGDVVERLTLPGGAWWLARAAELTEGRIKRIALAGHSPAREAVEAMLEHGSVRSVLLLGHQDCAWYRARFPKLSPGNLVREQGADILRARDEIERWAPRALAARAWLILTTAGGTTARRLD